MSRVAARRSSLRQLRMILDGNPGRIVQSHDLVGQLPSAIGQSFGHLRQRQIAQRRRRALMAHLPQDYFSGTPIYFRVIRWRNGGLSSLAVNSRTNLAWTSGWAAMVTSTLPAVRSRWPRRRSNNSFIVRK